jgi:hypothetical protein
MAHRNGWEVRSFPDLSVYHHRATGTAGTTAWRARFRDGMADYFVGYQMLFEIGKCVRRLRERPFLISGVLRLLGYVFPRLTGQARGVPDDLIRYLKAEQRRRVLYGAFGR